MLLSLPPLPCSLRKQLLAPLLPNPPVCESPATSHQRHVEGAPLTPKERIWEPISQKGWDRAPHPCFPCREGGFASDYQRRGQGEKEGRWAGELGLHHPAAEQLLFREEVGWLKARISSSVFLLFFCGVVGSLGSSSVSVFVLVLMLTLLLVFCFQC